MVGVILKQLGIPQDPSSLPHPTTTTTTTLNHPTTIPRAHILIDDAPAQQYVAATRPPLTPSGSTLTQPKMSLQDPSRTQTTDTLNARYERALKERLDLSNPSSPPGLEENQEPIHQLSTSTSSSSSSSNEPGSDFDWDQSDESQLDEHEKEIRRIEKTQKLTEDHLHHLRRAKRLRKLYLWFMRLSRLIRTSLILILGTGITLAYVV